MFDELLSTDNDLTVAQLASLDNQRHSGVLADTAKSLVEEFHKRSDEIIELLKDGTNEKIVGKFRGMIVCLTIIERRLDHELFLNMNDKFKDLHRRVQKIRPEITLSSVFKDVEEGQEEY